MATEPTTTVFAVREFEGLGEFHGDYIGTQVLRCGNSIHEFIAAMRSDPGMVEEQVQGRTAFAFDEELHEAQQYPDGRFPVSRRYVIPLDDHSLAVLTRPDLANFLEKDQGMNRAKLNKLSEPLGGEIDLSLPFTMIRRATEKRQAEARSKGKQEFGGYRFECSNTGDQAFKLRIWIEEPKLALSDTKRFLGMSKRVGVTRLLSERVDEDSLLIEGEFPKSERGLHGILILVMFGFSLTL